MTKEEFLEKHFRMYEETYPLAELRMIAVNEIGKETLKLAEKSRIAEMATEIRWAVLVQVDTFLSDLETVEDWEGAF